MTLHDSTVVGMPSGNVANVESGPEAFSFSSPGDLIKPVEVIPYPVESLPERAAKAVMEVVSHGKMPTAMVASSAMAGMSVAIQTLVNVARDLTFIGPVSLNLITVGMSGERKSTSDTAMASGIKDWEYQLKESEKPLVQEKRAKYEAWEAKMAGIKSALKRVVAVGQAKDKDGKLKGFSADELESQLIDLKKSEPQKTSDPRIFHEEATAEGLAWSVATGYHSQALWSDEAVIVVGGQGMRTESLLSFLGLLNRLWDGKPFSPTRKVADTAEIRGKRFTANLMSQLEVLSSLIDAGPTRGVGFLARFLISNPKSTMGERRYTDPPQGTPAVDAFNNKLSELMGEKRQFDENGVLDPAVLHFDSFAKMKWIEFHDAVEAELTETGEFFEVRDFASKAADNAARIAALFHVFDNGPSGDIEMDTMTRAIAIAAWHLTEAKALFSQLMEPHEMSNARKLSEWLRGPGRDYISETCGHFEIKGRSILQYGPYSVRTKNARDEALKILGDPDHQHIHLLTKEKRTVIHINPKLLGERP